MTRLLVPIILIIVILTLPSTAGAEDLSLRLPEAAQHIGSRYVLVILATDRNEPRVFEFNLDISVRWDALERREIVPVDVLPSRHNVATIARLLDVTDQDFAIVLLDRRGEPAFRTTDSGSLTEILARVDLLESRR